MTNPVRIITDSASDLSEGTLSAAGIEVVPLAIRFGDEELIDRVQLSNDDFWQRMETSDELPKTAAPSSADFVEAFERAEAGGATTIICITISSRLSATFQAATRAGEQFESGAEVHVIDSMSCTIAQGILCLEAARLAEQGIEAREIVGRIEDMKSRVRLYGTLDTLDNLRKGGRIGKASAFFGSILSIKPVITIRDGEVEPMSRQRTRRRALEHLASLLDGHSNPTHVTVAHSGAPDIEVFSRLLRDRMSNNDDVEIHRIGPVIGSHGGPRLVAVAFVDN